MLYMYVARMTLLITAFDYQHMNNKPLVVPSRIVCVELSVSLDLFQAMALIKCP